jgi:SAM-dependent methyltransferase
LPLEGLRCLEIGTGWIPALPICYSLSGATSCVTVDLVRHLDPELTVRFLRSLKPMLPTLAETSGRSLESLHVDLANLEQASNLTELLHRARLLYQAPADACATGLDPASLDLVFSNSVLEHIQPDVLPALMRETFRLLRPGGLAIHNVACYDHYAYFDHNITPINYLSYTEKQWRFWNCDLQYQNRLRAQDFLEAVERAGLELVIKRLTQKPEVLQAITRMKIAPEFQRYSNEQLCCTSLSFAARKP